MDEQIVKKIFAYHDLEHVRSFEKIEIGFTNQVFSVNDEFILKVCTDKDNEKYFEREVYFYDLFKDTFPVPQVSVYDDTKKVYDKVFMIYPKIQGNTLYSVWHTMSNDERKNIIHQLCNILRIINEISPKEFSEKFQMDLNVNWHDKIISSINRSLNKIKEDKLLPDPLIREIEIFVEENHDALNEQEVALVYWDAHFDNIVVQEGKIVGILDFERTDLSSIDFVLDIVKRMMAYPGKYMSEIDESNARSEDYMHLMDWYKNFYPELFKFNDLDKRLALYSLEHDVRDVTIWKGAEELPKMIKKTIGSILSDE